QLRRIPAGRRVQARAALDRRDCPAPGGEARPHGEPHVGRPGKPAPRAARRIRLRHDDAGQGGREMITLYDCSTAPSPRRARILLAAKDVRHDTVQVDLRNGEQLGEAYRKINPQCTVPALRTEDGFLLTDN